MDGTVFWLEPLSVLATADSQRKRGGGALR